MRSDTSSLREMDFGLGMFSTLTGRCQFQGGKLKCCYSGCPAVFPNCLKDATQLLLGKCNQQKTVGENKEGH